MSSSSYITHFKVHHEVAFGSKVVVVGSCRCLGNWSVFEGHPLRWSENHIWNCRVRHQDECIFSGGFEYKYIEWHRNEDDAPQWESRQNRRLELPAEVEAIDGTRMITTDDTWDSDFTVRTITHLPPADKVAVVVLGKRLLPTGAPSTTLEARMSAAVSLYSQVHASVIVLTGGRVETGAGTPGTSIDTFPSEAEVMQRLATESGLIPVSAVIRDDLAKNTIENALNVRDLAEDHGLGTLHIITSEYHLTRSRLIFEKIFASRPHIILEFHDHTSPISETERLKEEQVERFMIEKLPVHLRHYTNNH